MEKLLYVLLCPGGIAFSRTTCRNYSVQIVQKSNRKTNLSFSVALFTLWLYFYWTTMGKKENFSFFFQMGKSPVFKTSIALPMGRQSLHIAQGLRCMHMCMFSSYFHRTPVGGFILSIGNDLSRPGICL